LDIIGEASEYIEEYEVGVKSILFLDDIRAIAHSLSNAITTRRKAIRNWLQIMKGPKMFGLFSKDDPTPFLMNHAGMGYILLKQKSKNPWKISKHRSHVNALLRKVVLTGT